MERLEKILEIKVDANEAIKGIGRLNEKISEQRDLQAKLKKEIKELQDTEGDHTAEIEKKRIEIAQSNELTKTYSSEVQRLSKIVQNQLKMDKEEVGSLQRKRAELSKLTLEYDELSDAERNAAKGQELKDKINEVTDSLKGAEEATQRYYRNVGNYENAIKNAIGLNSKFGQALQKVAEMTKKGDGLNGDGLNKFGQALQKVEDKTKNSDGLNKFGQALQKVEDKTNNGITPALGAMKMALIAVGKQLLVLLANPIVAIIAALAAAFLGAAKGIKSSEDSMARLNAVTAVFKPIGDAVTNVFQAMGKALLSVVEWIGKGVGGFSKLLEKLPIVGDNIKAINDESRRYIQLEKDKQALIERNRDLIVSSAKAERDVAELRTKAKDKERYTDQERLKFVQEANEVERKIAAEKKAAAEEKLRLLKEEAAATENVAEVNDEIARAEAEVYRAETEYNTKIRELLEQELTIKNEIAAEDKARAEAKKKADEEAAKQAEEQRKQAEEQRKADEEALKEYNEKLNEAMQEAEDMLIELISEQSVKEEELERVRYERQVKAIQDKQSLYEQDSEIYKEYALQLELAAQQHAVNMQTISMEQRMKEVEEAKKAAEEEKRIAEEKVAREIELEKMKLSSYSSIAGSISSILEASAGDNKKRLKAAKLAALAEVAINQGVAIAQAVKAGGEYPFPVNLLTIASSVAGAIAALVPAFQAVNSVKLARGGRVSGPGTSTSDDIPAMLSNGEYVVNARATSMFPELLETINNLGLGLGAPARMEKVTTTRIERDNAEALVKALQQMPAPVVSVEEINRTSRRVEALERLSRLA